MASIKLSYCQLIRIILSQLGGNPLQLVYTQLTQGMPSVSMRSSLFSELSQIKQVIDEISSRIQAVTKDVNDYEKLARELAGQFLKNPVAASINALRAEVAIRLQTATGAELDELTALDAQLVEYLNITNKLSGVTPESGGQTCSLQDLLGNGCTPNKNVPDIDLQTLVQSLTKSNILNALKTALANGTGFSNLQGSITDLRTSITSIQLSFNNIFNKQFIKNAVTSYINQILFQLLSGCGNDVLALTLKDFTGTSFGSVDGLFNLSGLGTSNNKSVSVPDVTNVIVGQFVTGTNVAPNTTVVGYYTSNNTVVLSNNLLGNLSYDTLSFELIGSGTNINIFSAITQATEYLQNIYANGNSYVTISGNVFTSPNVLDSITIT